MLKKGDIVIMKSGVHTFRVHRLDGEYVWAIPIGQPIHGGNWIPKRLKQNQIMKVN